MEFAGCGRIQSRISDFFLRERIFQRTLNALADIACNFRGRVTVKLEDAASLSRNPEVARRGWSSRGGVYHTRKMNLIPFDPSKQPHPKTVALFVPFVPGIFLEVSLLAGGFKLDWPVPKAPSPYLEYYSWVALALFCAYFIGFAASLFTSLLQLAIKATYFNVARALPKAQRRVNWLLRSRSGGKGWVTERVLQRIVNH